MKRLPAFVIVVALAATQVFAQDQQPGEGSAFPELRERSDKFIGLIYEGRYQEAFELIRNLPIAISSENLSSLQDTVETQLDEIVNVYGDKLEVQFLGYNSISNFLVRYIYVIRYAYHFLWWQLVYYKGPEDKWLLSSIAFDDDTKALMDLAFSMR